MVFAKLNIICILYNIFLNHASALYMPQVYDHGSIDHTMQTKWPGKSINAAAIVQSSTIQHTKWNTNALFIAPIKPEKQVPELFHNNFRYYDDETGNHAFSSTNSGADPAHAVNNPQYKEEGTFCRSSFDGRGGYCILAHQCINAIHEYREHGTNLDICTYFKNIPVVCCPLSDKQPDERISAWKCKEYHKTVEGIKLSSARRFSGSRCLPYSPLIVGGETVHKNQFPHMAALGWSEGDNIYKFLCGGSLISDLYVLTAAHCITSGESPPDIVRLGALNLNIFSRDQQDIKILLVILHPKYHTSTYYHDIALLKLTNSARISPQVQPACLWQMPDLNVSTVTATGWGRIEALGPTSDELKKVDFNIIDHNTCKNLYHRERRFPEGIIDNQLCAGILDGGRDTCRGDSGGPLHAQLPEFNCITFVVGVTSFGRSCAEPNAPGVYTKVYPYLDWIEDIVFRDSSIYDEKLPK